MGKMSKSDETFLKFFVKMVHTNRTLTAVDQFTQHAFHHSKILLIEIICILLPSVDLIYLGFFLFFIINHYCDSIGTSRTSGTSRLSWTKGPPCEYFLSSTVQITMKPSTVGVCLALYPTPDIHYLPEKFRQQIILVCKHYMLQLIQFGRVH